MKAHHITPPIALTIAGSDSGGGAGIQADLRAFMAFRVHGCSALSCVTAQNTCGVDRVDPIPPAGLKAQLQAMALACRQVAAEVTIEISKARSCVVRVGGGQRALDLEVTSACDFGRYC